MVNMKKKIVIGVIILIGIVAIGFYFWNFTRTINIENINDCVLDSDCVIVTRSICGGALAINKDNSDMWNKNLENKKKISGNVICKQTLPLDYFNAKCVNNKCTSIQIKP